MSEMPEFRDFVRGFRDCLVCLLLIGIIAVVFQAYKAVKTVDETVKIAPVVLQVELQKTRDVVHVDLQQTRDFTVEQIGALAKTTDKRLASIQHDVKSQLSNFTKVLNRQLYEVKQK
jgi:hypothetical protein